MGSTNPGRGRVRIFRLISNPYHLHTLVTCHLHTKAIPMYRAWQMIIIGRTIDNNSLTLCREQLRITRASLDQTRAALESSVEAQNASCASLDETRASLDKTRACLKSNLKMQEETRSCLQKVQQQAEERDHRSQQNFQVLLHTVQEAGTAVQGVRLELKRVLDNPSKAVDAVMFNDLMQM